MNHLLYERHQEYAYKQLHNLESTVPCLGVYYSKVKMYQYAFHLLLLFSSFFDYCIEIRSQTLSYGVDGLNKFQQLKLERSVSLFFSLGTNQVDFQCYDFGAKRKAR